MKININVARNWLGFTRMDSEGIVILTDEHRQPFTFIVSFLFPIVVDVSIYNYKSNILWMNNINTYMFKWGII